MNKLVVICGAFLITTLTACGRGSGQPVPLVQTSTGSLAITCIGKIAPGEGILRISAPAQSVVADLKVKRGSLVRQGQVLATLLDYRSFVAAIWEADQQVAVAESAVAQAKAPERPAVMSAQEAAIAKQNSILGNAERDYRRKKQLFDEKLIPATDLDSAQLNLNTAREGLRHEREVFTSLGEVRDVDVAVADRKLAAAVAARERTSVEAERNLIRAPIGGTVLEIYARSGEAVSADQGILDLGDTVNMYVEAEVYASDIRRVREGAKATVTGESFEGQIHGVVSEILREASHNSLVPGDPLSAADRRIVKVRIRLDNSAPVSRLSGSQVAVRIEAVQAPR